MKFGSKKNIIPLSFLLVGRLFGAASATEDADLEQKQRVRKVDEFEYQLENRADPFLPFIDDNEQGLDPDDEIVDEENRPLTGMQLFEPGQLTLVAVMSVGSKNIAMVEDHAGKGYRLDVGMPIGKRGIIHHIGKDEVKITETSKTRAGRIIKKEIVMRLKKEEDR